jgi:hypothetical protein
VGGVRVPFLADFSAHARFLVSLPLLLIAELIVHHLLRGPVKQFVVRGIIPEEDLPRYTRAVESAIRWRNSAAVEVVLFIIAFVVGHWLWREQIALPTATWYATEDRALTAGGMWYALVSLPIYRFMLLRWLYRLFIWHRFLWQVSRLSLRLNALHPDRAGGLGFVGNSVFAFATVLLAISALLAGQIADHIFHEGAKLPQFYVEIAGFAILNVALVLLSQLFFVMPLLHARRECRREYGLKAAGYVDAFREKWLVGRANSEEMLGSADIQSLADLAGSYDIVREMRIVPVGRKEIVRLAILFLLPIAPLAFTMIPLREMVDRLFKVFL